MEHEKKEHESKKVERMEKHEKGESKLKEKKEHLAKKMHGKMKERWTEGHKAGSMSYLGKK